MSQFVGKTLIMHRSINNNNDQKRANSLSLLTYRTKDIKEFR